MPCASQISRRPSANSRVAGMNPASPWTGSKTIAAENVAAIVFEPVQGEAGFIPATREFAEGLREICDAHGIVLVCAEVQSGFARTGRFFSLEHYVVEPEIG